MAIFGNMEVAISEKEIETTPSLPTLPSLSESLPDIEAGASEIVDVDMHEIGITDSDSESPIVGTTGLTSSIALEGIEVGSEPRSDPRIGTMIHLTPSDSVQKAFGALAKELESRYGRPLTLKVRALASNAGYEKKVDELTTFVLSHPVVQPNLSLELVEHEAYQCEMEELGEGFATLEGFALDTRDGNTYRYAPRKHEIGTHPSNIKIPE